MGGYFHSIANGFRCDVCSGCPDLGGLPNVLTEGSDDQGLASYLHELLPRPLDASFLHLENVREIDLDLEGDHAVGRSS
jgi:hypothetical protein